MLPCGGGCRGRRGVSRTSSSCHIKAEARLPNHRASADGSRGESPSPRSAAPPRAGRHPHTSPPEGGAPRPLSLVAAFVKPRLTAVRHPSPLLVGTSTVAEISTGVGREGGVPEPGPPPSSAESRRVRGGGACGKGVESVDLVAVRRRPAELRIELRRRPSPCAPSVREEPSAPRTPSCPRRGGARGAPPLVPRDPAPAAAAPPP
jgi:hypothetical protein